MSNSRQIKNGVILSYLAISVNVVAGIFFTPWMVRTIGRSDYGLFVLVTSFLTYFIFDFGLGQAIARFIAKYRTEGNEQNISKLLGVTVKIYVILDIIILIAFIAIYFFIQKIFVGLTLNELYRFKIVYCIAGIVSIISFPFTILNGVLIAYERFVILKLCEIISKLGIVAFMSLALLVGYRLYALVTINAIMAILIILIKIHHIIRRSPVRIDLAYRSGKQLAVQLVKFSLWITMFKIGQMLLVNVAPSVLGIWAGTEQISIFAIGMIIYGYAWTLASALNGMFMTKMSELSVKVEKKKQIDDLMICVGRYQLMLVGLMLIGLISIGKQFIILWMGHDYQKSYYVALLLVTPGIITMTQEIGITLLLVDNHLLYGAVLNIAASVMSLVVSIILVPRYGAIGAAISISTAFVVFQIFGMNIVYSKVLGIDIKRYFCECHIKMILPICLSLTVGLIIHEYFPSHSLIALLPQACVLTVAYVTILWKLGLRSDEKSLILLTAKEIFVGVRTMKMPK